MANILSPILIVRLSDLFCGNGPYRDHVAKEFHEEAVQIGLGPLRMQEENPLHVTGRGGERGSVHNSHPRKVIYLRVLSTFWVWLNLTLRFFFKFVLKANNARLSQHDIDPKMTAVFSNFCRKKFPGLTKEISCTY